MRIALMTDVHGNREAFTACLDHAGQNDIDRYVFLGDFVGYGADPGWVVDTARTYVERGAVAILGNHDAAVLADSAGMNEMAATAIAWTRTQLDDSQRNFIAGLPLLVEDGDRLYVHASAHEPDQWHYVLDIYAAAESLVATDAHTTYCGHTHVPALFHMTSDGDFASFKPVEREQIPLDRQHQWLAVIGSVGQPRDRNPAAGYTLFDTTREEVTFFRVPYDHAGAAAKIRAARLPESLAYRVEMGI